MCGPFFLALAGGWLSWGADRGADGWACWHCEALHGDSKGLPGNSEGRMRGAGAEALKRLGNISGFYSPRFTLILLIPYTCAHAHARAHAHTRA